MSEPIPTGPTGEIQKVDLDTLRYKEQLAEKMGLPSHYAMGLLKDVCVDLVESGFAPQCFKNNPAALFLAAMRGRELGLDPIESILDTFWASPQGRLGMYANKMLDLLHRNGVKSRFIEESSDACEIVFTPPNNHEPYTARFERLEATRAGLVKPESNWVKWPSDMCRARAISRGWRALAGVAGGTSANLYSQEEITDIEQTEGTGERQKEQDLDKGFTLGRKRKATPMADPPPAPEPTPPAPPAPPAEPDPPSGYQIYRVSDSDRLEKTDEPILATDTAAVERAQALANEKGKRFAIMDLSTRKELARYQPALAMHAPAAQPRLSEVGSGEWVKGEMDRLRDILGGDRKAAQIVKTFIKGWYSAAELPGDPKQYIAPLAKLDAILHSGGDDMAALFRNAYVAGQTSQPPVLDDDFFRSRPWTAATQEYARTLFRTIGCKNRGDFIPYLIAIRAEELPDSEAQPLFRLAARILDVTRLLALVDQLKEHGVGYESVLFRIEKDSGKKVEDLAPEAIREAIERYLLFTHPAEEPPPIAAEPAQL